MCRAHVQHPWPPREVQEEVTALGIALGARREPCRAGGAAGVGGGSSTGVRRDWVRGIRVRLALRWPLQRWGRATAPASAGAGDAEAAPGAAGAECPAAATSAAMGGTAVADGTGG